MTTLTHILTTERDTRRFRLLSLVVVAATLNFRVGDISLGPALLWIAIFFVYTLLLGKALKRLTARTGAAELPYLIYGMIVVDSISVTALVHFTGGIASITVILIPLFIMYHTTYLSKRSGLVSAAIFAVLYLFTAQLEGEVAGRAALLIGQVGLFFLLAVFSAYLGRRTLTEINEREVLQDLIFDAGLANGVHVEPMSVEDDIALFDGKAPDEESIEQFIERLQAMRRLTSVRLALTPPVATQEGESNIIPFSVSARLR